jgi:AcrR family transcriptional regulator
VRTPKTREKIINTAILLFSDSGYDNVSMRNIAALVGIKAASIYNHFSSKRDILKSMYEFYAGEFFRFAPALEELLHLAETAPVHEIIFKLEFYHPPELREKLDRIFITACQRFCLDKDSEFFVKEQLLKPLIELYSSLLTRLIELGKIESIDVDSFTRLLMHFAFSVSFFGRTGMKISAEQWRSSLCMLFSLLKTIKE